MNCKPLVTIVTVTKNLYIAGRDEFFRQCVASVKEQDYPCIEHLIIDGGSTDNSLSLFEELGLQYYSEKDSGVYEAFNKGIKLAKGKYIAFLNSDDFYISNQAVSKSVEALEEKQADFSYAYFNIVDLNGSFIKNIAPNWKECFVKQPIGHPTMFSTKAMLKELKGFDTSYKITGDFDLITRAILAGKRPVGVDATISAFREGGISNIQKDILNTENIRVIATNLKISPRKAEKAFRFAFLPKKILLNLLDRTVDFPDKELLLKNHFRRFVRYIRKQIISIRFRKGKRHVVLLGFTLYNGEN
ncbi:MAG: glycosyltransferase [Alphaproteobacteria bacterium]|nr:glycosyltransferase [Alphaproteobacteria bacterium]